MCSDTANTGPLREDPREEVWRNWQGGVLLLDEIRYYCEQSPPMIESFNEECLKPASYHLRLGEGCRVEGEDVNLSHENPTLTIPPHGLAIVSTLEKVSIPTFLVARWNLKVKKVYYGLVWVGSLQVDPGYQGLLFCPLYNLSTQPVKLEYGETLFTIDFVRTTRYDESNNDRPWTSAEGRPTTSFKPLDVVPLRSAPKKTFDEMREVLDNRRTDVDGLRTKIDSFQAVTFTVLGIIVAALSFLAINEFGGIDTSDPKLWQMTSWLLLLGVIVILVVVLAVAAIRALFRK